MSEQEFLKAIKCSKEELIEWLNEQYKQEKRLKEIIQKYEDTCNAYTKRETIKTTDIEGKDKVYIKETIMAEINGNTIEYVNYEF